MTPLSELLAFDSITVEQLKIKYIRFLQQRLQLIVTGAADLQFRAVFEDGDAAVFGVQFNLCNVIPQDTVSRLKCYRLFGGLRSGVGEWRYGIIILVEYRAYQYPLPLLGREWQQLHPDDAG